MAAPPVQQTPVAPAAASSVEPEISWRKLPANLLHDQKEIWLFPTQLARGRHWLPTTLVVGGTAGTHFPSDVFLGAALGYSIARFDVLREH